MLLDQIRRRTVAAGIHFLVSLVIGALVGILVFGLWYPGSYRYLAGGQSLFIIAMSVDITVGPLLTFAIFNSFKSGRQLTMDLGIIAVAQVLALAYGLHTVYIARPVVTVFEVDRFRVLVTDQIATDELTQALPEFRHLPLNGPWLLGTRAPSSPEESNEAMLKGINGIDIGQRPKFWQAYARSAKAAFAKARPVDVLLARYQSSATQLQELLRQMHIQPSSARFLPVVARVDWVAVLDASGALIGFLPVSGFF